MARASFMIMRSALLSLRMAIMNYEFPAGPHMLPCQPPYVAPSAPIWEPVGRHMRAGVNRPYLQGEKANLTASIDCSRYEDSAYLL